MSQATLDARLRLNSADFHGGLSKASRDAKQAASEMSKSFAGMRDVLTGGIGLAFGTTAIKAIFDARIEVEKLQSAMTATMGSAALGQQTFEKIKQMSGDIGLGVQAAAKSFIQLQSAGMKTAEAFKMIRAGYNAIVSTGGGAEEFSRFSVAIQQLRNSPKPLQEELNQLREALPSTAKLMQEAFGVQRAEDLQKLGISGRDFVDTIGEMLAKLPQVGNTLGKEVARLSTVWTDFKASLGNSLLGDMFQATLNGAQSAIQGLNDAREGIAFAIESALGIYDPTAPRRQAEAAAAAQDVLDQDKPTLAGLTPEEVEEWKKENKKWQEELKRTREKNAQEELDVKERLEGWEIEYQKEKAERQAEYHEQVIADTEEELRKMEEAAAAMADQKVVAMQGVADAQEMMQDELSKNINKNIENKLKSRSERRAEADEKRRFEKAKASEEAALAKKMLKEDREAFKKDELDNLKKGKVWNEEKAKMKARADAQDAVKKATEDGAMTLKDILVVLKTLSTA